MNARKLGVALLQYAIEELLEGGTVAQEAWEFLMLPPSSAGVWTAETAAKEANLSLPELRQALRQRGFTFPPPHRIAIPAPCIPKTCRTQAGWIRCKRCWSLAPVWDIHRAKTCIPCGRRTPRWYARKKEHAA